MIIYNFHYIAFNLNIIHGLEPRSYVKFMITLSPASIKGVAVVYHCYKYKITAGSGLPSTGRLKTLVGSVISRSPPERAFSLVAV